MVDLLEARRRIILNTPHLESLSGATASFETDMASKLKECKVYFTPIQEGTGDPSPDNVRTIHGWDGVTVTRCGKNLTPDYSNADFWNKNAYFSVNGNITNNNNYRMCDYKLALPNKTYIFSSSNAGWKGIGFYDAAYNPIAFKEASTNSIQLYAPSNTKFYRVYGYWSLLNKQLEEGSEATDYELYTETQITIPFPQTIYGGYVDLVNGEVVETYVSRKINTTKFGQRLYTHSSTGYKGSYNYYVSGGLADFPRPLSAATYMCDRLSIGADTTKKAFTWNKFGNSGSYIYVYVDPNELSEETLSAVRAYISDLDPQFVYKVRNETDYTTYPLDPVTIRTLKGINNIWSNANGNIEVKFWTH